MAKIKKSFCILFLSFITCLVFLCSGCNVNKIEGVYKFKSMTYNEGGVSVEIKAGEKIMGMVTLSEDYITLSINKDGTATMKNDDEEILIGTWTKVDNKQIALTFEDEIKTCSCDGKTITIEETGEGKIVFEK